MVYGMPYIFMFPIYMGICTSQYVLYHMYIEVGVAQPPTRWLISVCLVAFFFSQYLRLPECVEDHLILVDTTVKLLAIPQGRDQWPQAPTLNQVNGASTLP